MPVDCVRIAGLHLAPVTGKGMGLFCRKNIAAQQVIETSPMIVFSADDAAHIDQTSLYNYYFALKFLSAAEAARLKIGATDKAGGLPLGLLSMANHAENPSAVVAKDVAADGAVYATLTATRAIPAGTEITISYGSLWFEPV